MFQEQLQYIEKVVVLYITTKYIYIYILTVKKAETIFLYIILKIKSLHCNKMVNLIIQHNLC